MECKKVQLKDLEKLKHIVIYLDNKKFDNYYIYLIERG